MCNKCGKQGHKAVDCRVKLSTNGSNKWNHQGGNGVPKTAISDKKCYGCGKMGHIAANCPDKNQDTGMFVGVTVHDKSDEMFGSLELEGEPYGYDPKLDLMSEYWLADTGSTCHVTASADNMTNFDPTYRQTIKVGNGEDVQVEGKGSLELLDPKSGKRIRLQDVLYAPAFKKNILSMYKMTAGGDTKLVGGRNSFQLVRNDGRDVIDFERRGLLFYFVGRRVRSYAQVVAATTTAPPKTMSFNEAHRKFAHMAETPLRRVAGYLGITLTGKLDCCESCAMAKAKQKSVPKVRYSVAESPGERIMIDTSGPYPESIGGTIYWLKMNDDYTDKCWDRFMKKKSEVPRHVDELLTQLRAMERPVKFLRCDNAGEHRAQLVAVANKHGVQLEYTAPHTPQQNGKVERRFATDHKRAMSMMSDAKLTAEQRVELRAEAQNTASKIYNMLSITEKRKVPPDVKFFGGDPPPMWHHLFEFGRVAYVTRRQKILNKMEDRAIKCLYVGTADNHPADTFRLYNPATKWIMLSRDVKWGAWHAPNPAHQLGELLFDPEAGDGIRQPLDIDSDDDVEVSSATGSRGAEDDEQADDDAPPNPDPVEDPELAAGRMLHQVAPAADAEAGRMKCRLRVSADGTGIETVIASHQDGQRTRRRRQRNIGRGATRAS
jgi:transposase InsO family protein